MSTDTITIPPKSSAKIFREAAELLELRRSHYCCSALEALERDCDSAEAAFLAGLFRPERPEHFLGWWESDSLRINHVYEPRILALLFCAEICERQEF